MYHISIIEVFVHNNPLLVTSHKPFLPKNHYELIAPSASTNLHLSLSLSTSPAAFDSESREYSVNGGGGF